MSAVEAGINALENRVYIVSPSEVVIRVLSNVPLSALKGVSLLLGLYDPVGNTDDSITSFHPRRLIPTVEMSCTASVPLSLKLLRFLSDQTFEKILNAIAQLSRHSLYSVISH